MRGAGRPVEWELLMITIKPTLWKRSVVISFVLFGALCLSPDGVWAAERHVLDSGSWGSGGHVSAVRGISKGSLAFTHPGHSPRLWPPDGTGALGLFPGLHTRLSRTQPRMPGRGRASGTGPGSRRRHQRPPPTDPLNTSGLMSQFTRKVLQCSWNASGRAVRPYRLPMLMAPANWPAPSASGRT